MSRNASNSSQQSDSIHFQTGARRSNRNSQMTMSSVSSDNSSSAMSPSTIRQGQPWGLPAGFEKRPSVATVFEDEPLDDVEYDGVIGNHDMTQAHDWQTERENLRNQGRTSGGLQLSTSAPTSNRMYGPVPSAARSQRASTVSNATTSSAKSKSGSGHPFASMHRAPSPLLEVPEQMALPPVSTSRSAPSLYDSYKIHASLPTHQVALVSAEDEEDDAICPLCTESLSFAYRLPGEKPHIIPECGHPLHHVSILRLCPLIQQDCFIECYGSLPTGGSRQNYGVCGMCRQPMRITAGGQERGPGKSSELLNV